MCATRAQPPARRHRHFRARRQPHRGHAAAPRHDRRAVHDQARGAVRLKLVFFDPFRQWDDVAEALRAYPGIEFAHPADNAGARRGARRRGGAGDRQPQLPRGDRGNRSATTARRCAGSSSRPRAPTTPSSMACPRESVVTNMAGLRAFSVAEQAFALMLGLVRKIRPATEARGRTRPGRATHLIPVADNLAGKHLHHHRAGRDWPGRRAQGQGVRHAGDRCDPLREPVPHVDRIRPREELVEACAEADIVLMAALYEDGTDRLLSRPRPSRR